LTRYDACEVLLGRLDICADHFHLAVWAACGHHNVGAVGEFVNVAGEKFVFDNHRFEVVVSFDAGQLKLLNNVRYFFKSMIVCVTYRVKVGNYEKSRLFEKNNFVGIYGLAKSFEREL